MASPAVRFDSNEGLESILVAEAYDSEIDLGTDLTYQQHHYRSKGPGCTGFGWVV